MCIAAVHASSFGHDMTLHNSEVPAAHSGNTFLVAHSNIPTARMYPRSSTSSTSASDTRPLLKPNLDILMLVGKGSVTLSSSRCSSKAVTIPSMNASIVSSTPIMSPDCGSCCNVRFTPRTKSASTFFAPHSLSIAWKISSIMSSDSPITSQSSV